MKQLFLGVNLSEQQWLNKGAASTHVLHGKLRVFSYFSDAAQFGANQAHTALVFGIIGLYKSGKTMSFLGLLVATLALYGMLISGTRGVLAVLAFGGLTYLIMTKNFRVVLLGLMVAAGCFIFLKYTSIGQSNYQINRVRTALDFDDPSFKVRQVRINTLSSYLANKPLGGGIGSAGYWGKRFSPGTFLAEIGTDGHYTRIWMETGKIGLYLYIAILLVIIFYLGKLLWKMKESKQRQILMAFYCGFVGMCAASYTNGLITQFPTGALTFTSLGFIYLGAKGKLNK
jgi:O-antigen ligase